jgi:hypothetical protein
MSWKNKYQRSVEDYLLLTDRYPVRLEYIDGDIQLNTGDPVLLLGDISPEEKPAETALVLISDVTEEEVALLAEFVASLRKSEKGK